MKIKLVKISEILDKRRGTPQDVVCPFFLNYERLD